jgi:hypothetical protein
MSTVPDTHVFRVAVRVAADVRPRQLSWILDLAFEDLGEIVAFSIEEEGSEVEREEAER